MLVKKMKDKVLVAMSGGVDSSVALLKIIEMGCVNRGIFERFNFEI